MHGELVAKKLSQTGFKKPKQTAQTLLNIFIQDKCLTLGQTAEESLKNHSELSQEMPALLKQF